MASALLTVHPDMASLAQVCNKLVLPPVCILRLTLHAVQVCVQVLAPDGGLLSLATQYGVEGCPGGRRSRSFNYYPLPLPCSQELQL